MWGSARLCGETRKSLVSLACLPAGAAARRCGRVDLRMCAAAWCRSEGNMHDAAAGLHAAVWLDGSGSV